MYQPTKKEYERAINELGVPHSELKCFGGRIPTKTKKYGSWIRRNDPIEFNTGFNEWSRENIQLQRKQKR